MLNLVLKVLPHRPWRAAGHPRAKPRARVSWGHFRDSEAENEPISALSSGWGGPPDLLRWRTRGLVYFGGHGTCAARGFSRSRALLSGVVEWADPPRVFVIFRSFFGQTEGTSAFSDVELAIKRTSPASGTPWVGRRGSAPGP